MTSLIFSEKKKINFRVGKKSKAWVPNIKKLSVKQSYFFKGRLGKRAYNKLFIASKVKRQHVFLLQNIETGSLTTSQMEVLWRSIRRNTRRFNVNLKRLSLISWLRLTATLTQNKRKKGGRMGSGKSPLVGYAAPINSGNFFFFANELRQKPLYTFLSLRSVLKKISLRSSIKYVF